MPANGQPAFLKIAHPKKRAFLRAFALCGVVGRADKMAQISRRRHYQWMDEPGLEGDSYRAAFARAYQAFGETLEQEAHRRAVKGVRKPVLWHGQPVFVWRDANGNIVEEGTPGATKEALIESEFSNVSSQLV